MSFKAFSLLVGLTLTTSTLLGAEPRAIMPEKHLDLFDAYCMDCHDADTQKGKVNLEDLPLEVNTLQHAELWQKVLNVMNSGEMPPENKRQPEKVEKADFLEDLAKTMVLARKKLSDSGGQITMRRLNRREYQNTMKSLTGVSLNVDSLPADGGSGTFDTVGASQFISSDQFEQYLELGRTAVDEAFARYSTMEKPSMIFRVEPEKTINPANEKIIKKAEAAQDRFKQWKKGVDESAKSPENQAIIAEIRKKNRLIDHPNRFYIFAEHFKNVPSPKDFGFLDFQKAAAADPSRSKNLALLKHYASLPHRDTGTYLKLTHGTGRVIVAPKKMAVGDYIFRVRLGTVKGTPAARKFIEIGHPQRDIESRDWGLKGKPISVHQVTGTIEDPQIMEIPIEVRSDTVREFAVQEKQPNNANLKTLWDEHNKLKSENGYGHPPAIWVDWAEIEGPIPKNQVPESTITRVEAEKVINPKQEKFIKDKEKWFERFRQWQKGVDAVVNTPENQAIIAEIAKTEKRILEPYRFYSIADRLKGTPDAKDFGFNDAPNANSANPARPSPYRYFKHYVGLPHRESGAYLMPTKGPGRVVVSPEKLPSGKYTLRARVGIVEGSDPSRHFIQFGHPQRTYSGLEWDYGLKGRSISTHQVTGT
ncbi:MAG: DUF1587 domain-containing protein, partial [Opitutae bacterium]|nr:DUF1587 domain-containing protein [Opitutae bacterium]